MIPAATEAAWRDVWLEQLCTTRPTTPTQLAIRGGELADRPAWVFIAAYQATMQQCWPELATRPSSAPGWASYLVSERRSDPAQPTCGVRETGDSFVLHGTKSWLAAAAHLDVLVVRTQLHGKPVNLWVPADAPGVTINPQTAGFLADLSQGGATFDNVQLPASAVLGGAATALPNYAPLFGLIEARCLLLALSSHFAAVVSETPEVEVLQHCKLQVAGLSTANLDSQASVSVLLEAVEALLGWFRGWQPQPDKPAELALWNRWQIDERLVGMHKPVLRKRLRALVSAV